MSRMCRWRLARCAMARLISSKSLWAAIVFLLPCAMRSNRAISGRKTNVFATTQALPYDLQLKAVGWARAVILPMGAALVGISLATPLVSHSVFSKWFSMPEFIGLLPIPVACAVAFYAAFHVITKPKVVAAGYGWVVFACTVLLFVLAFLGLAYSIYPYIVIDKLTVRSEEHTSELQSH